MHMRNTGTGTDFQNNNTTHPTFDDWDTPLSGGMEEDNNDYS